MFKIAIVVLGALLVMVGVIVGRTLFSNPRSAGQVERTASIVVDQDAAAARLAGAIRIKTVSYDRKKPAEPETLQHFHRYLEENFPRVHQALKKEVINAHSLLYTWTGSDPELKPVLFAAHMDVVPVEPRTETDWAHPAFSGEIAGGFIWGRGTLDMKQSLLAQMEAAELLISTGFAPVRTIYFAFGHDEEIGGESGAGAIAKLLAERGIKIEFVLDEGSAVTQGIVPGVERPAAIIGITEKGVAELQLVAFGTGGHSARPPKDNAVAQMGRAIAALQANPMPAKLRSPVTDMFDRLAPEMPFTTRLIIANRWLFEPLLLKRLSKGLATNASIRTTITPTIVEGGIKANVIPQKVSTTLNVRLLPGDTLDEVLQHIASTTGAVLDSDDSNRLHCEPVPCLVVGTTEKQVWRAAAVSDVESRSYGALMKTVGQTFPDVAIAPGMVLGITDSRHYRTLSDKIFRFVPMRLSKSDLPRIHGTNERISVANYAEIVRFYGQLLRIATAQ